MILKTTGWCFDMDDNYSINMLKKAAFIDELRNYLFIVFDQAKDNEDWILVTETEQVIKYFENRIEHLTKLSK